ncbi:bis(5'-nucleosyl)-tetraphosphatase (symmetrical) YqeK [Aliibacillus thermotolerans]|uniref:bis(5'-nucleosyl)-tetraphosphatase (symmetrical) n=1 Tax=Aliibacillus thermotolerans TaxID=1834418 RepID=A0ABW0U8F5_9BACI|nr:bis(5'-nucleosyl)-tetraphosphatase (symmetrical) YqeK [Aliibacillus thermotolerans]MDA3130770.1 HD domain-containing protein [Aliibacillus thermotolerans]
MDKKIALAKVKPHLTNKRYVHTIGVLNTAVSLVEEKEIDIDIEAIRLAAIFHDYAKYRPAEELRNILQENGQDQFLHYGEEVLHAPAGAYLVRKELGITNEKILSAIFWHTTGKRNMNMYEKILYLSDYIEPNRSFPGVDEVREVAKESIDQAIVLALRNTITFLVNKRQLIFPETVHAYNDMLNQLKREDDSGE